ncbi:hypothetical protein M3Y97_00700100 [Aphelenchoides bicaudatus]|nr:hypothetical protein M3Y97_00700100 [Aphelenchoides bicaudatus]
MLFTSSCDNNDQCEMSLCQKTLEMILPLLNEDALRLPTLSSAFFRLLLNISEASPNVFLFIDNALSEKLLHCLCWAIGGAAGMEPTKLALETIQIVCRTLGMSTDTAQGAFVQSLFRILTAKLFEVAFNSSTELEMELQLHAIRGLYAVIRLNQQYFSEYVHSLFTRPANASNYERLIENYNQLILPGEQLADTRQAFGTFNKRFEKFVGSVESILVV